jgi:hypothetical protein
MEFSRLVWVCAIVVVAFDLGHVRLPVIDELWASVCEKLFPDGR